MISHGHAADDLANRLRGYDVRGGACIVVVDVVS